MEGHHCPGDRDGADLRLRLRALPQLHVDGGFPVLRGGGSAAQGAARPARGGGRAGGQGDHRLRPRGLRRQGAFNYGNAARYESIEDARELDDRTLRAWQGHHALYVVDNSVDFEDKINRAVAQIYRVLGESAPEPGKHKYLVRMPDRGAITKNYGALPLEMMQTYLLSSDPEVERRIRQQSSFGEQLFFYTTKRVGEDGTRWVTERPISEKEYVACLMEADLSLHSVRKLKYRFNYARHRMELDVYPFAKDRAIFFVYGAEPFELPPEIEVIREVTGDPEFKNRSFADRQSL